MTGEFGVAVHALVYLNHKAKTLSSDELARNICTNPARVRKIMAKLKTAGLVRTKEGTDGGYVFCLNPKEVSLRQIADAAGVVFVSCGWRSGDEDMDCLVASGMADIMDKLYADMNTLCREKLEHITVADIDRMIFGKETE